MVSSVSRRKQLGWEKLLILLVSAGILVYASAFVLSNLQTFEKWERVLLYIRDFSLGSLLISAMSLVFFKSSHLLKISWGLALIFELLMYLYFEFASYIGRLPFSGLAVEMAGSFISIVIVFCLRVFRYEKSFI